MRLPSRYEREGSQFSRDEHSANFLRRVSNLELIAETLWSFETGYRHQVLFNLSFDLAGFYNIYSNSETELESTVGNHQELNLFGTQHVHVYGFEFFGNWNVFDRLRLIPGHSLLISEAKIPLGHEIEEGEDPKHQFSFRSQLNVTRNIELDAFFRYIDDLPGLEVSSYKALDLRLAWLPVAGLELSLIGQNLLQSHHFEYTPEIIQTMLAQIQRSVFGRITWRF